MKKCGYGCGYWDDRADSCNCNPKPVTERTKESVGCKFHNGPDAPIEGQMEFDTPLYLLGICRSCKHNPATSPRACGFEQIPDEETGEVAGLKCTGFEHVEDPANNHGSLCSRCERDMVNGAEEPCGGVVDDIDGTCGLFNVAADAWPCNVCAHEGIEVTDDGYKCDMQDDGLCASFERDINQLCKGCGCYVALEHPGFCGPTADHICEGKADGSVECDDFVDPPATDLEQEVSEEEAEKVEA